MAKTGTKQWYGGIMKAFTLKPLKQRRREVLEDPAMEPILRRFYEEGRHYILYGKEFEEVRQDLMNE